MDETLVYERRPSDRLNQEWRRLCTDRRSNDHAAGWELHDYLGRSLRMLSHVLGACGLDRSIPDALADQLLADVIRLAIGGDRLAGRVVLQRISPALLYRAGRRARLGGSMPGREIFDEFLATAWPLICEYPLDRRPAKIAANLIRDTEKAIFGEVASRPFRWEVPYREDSLPVIKARRDGRPADYEIPAPVLLERVVSCAVAHGMNDQRLDLLLAIYVRRERCWRVARRMGISTRTLATRRIAAEKEFVAALKRSGEDFGE